jgi:hypothetical protein
MLLRGALNEAPVLGGLYDARADRHLPYFITDSVLPSTSIITIDTPRTDFFLEEQDKFERRRKMLGIDANLSISVMAGMVEVKGAGRFLNDEPVWSTINAHYNAALN